MTCLLAAATAKEISPFLDHYQHSANRHDVDIVITGIGLTATTYSLLKQISIKKPAMLYRRVSPGASIKTFHRDRLLS